MSKVATINPQKIQNSMPSQVRQIVNMFKKYHVPLRLVGGAVRDLLQNQKPRDFDFVVKTSPSGIIWVLEKNGIQPDTGGITHGTVKAKYGYGDSEYLVDITALGFRIRYHNDHLGIAQNETWSGDAQLRDLTVNSMSMTLDGQVYDYTDGYTDLKNHVVRLCAHSRASLHEDPIMIMRYFRALGRWPDTKVVLGDLKLIRENVHLLADLADDERVQKNLIDIQASPNSKQILDLMQAVGIPRYLPYVLD
jgi:poly(A) polymerase